MTRSIGSIVALVGALLVSESAAAQIFTPTYMAPRSSGDIGIYVNDGPGSFSVEGIWRQRLGGYDLGLRAGLADTDGVSIVVGADLRNPITAGAPLDLAVTGGAQGEFGNDRSAGGFQVGLSVGHTFTTPGLSFTPYLHPRVGLVKPSRRSDFGLELLADLGFDVGISPNLDLRFGIAFDDFGAGWGVGFAWR
jgi:hypothetical protein